MIVSNCYDLFELDKFLHFPVHLSFYEKEDDIKGMMWENIDSTHSIRLNLHNINKTVYPNRCFKRVLLHELAHSLAFTIHGSHSHDADWRRVLRKLKDNQKAIFNMRV